MWRPDYVALPAIRPMSAEERAAEDAMIARIRQQYDDYALFQSRVVAALVAAHRDANQSEA